jgi:hypothetical protein
MDAQAQLDIIHALGASHYVVNQLTDVDDIGKQQVARQYRSVGFSRLSGRTRGCSAWTTNNASCHYVGQHVSMLRA